VILEFTGLSGAGKTTSEPYVTSCLIQQGVKAVLRGELEHRYKQGLITPRYADHRGLRILSDRVYAAVNWKTLIGAGLGREIIRAAMAKRLRLACLWLGEDINLSTFFLDKVKRLNAGSSVYMPHEGFVHHSACLRLWGGGSFLDVPESLLQKFSSETFTIFYFKISVEQALERLLRRGVPKSWQLGTNSKASIREVLLRFNDAIECNVEKFRADGAKVLTIDASLEPQHVESRLATILKDFPQFVNG
jgi:thymidylate kinase